MSIADKLITLNSIKQAIKSAINNKGVTVTDNDSFTVYAEKIGQIQTGSTINNQNKSVNITQNGQQNITYDSGYTGLGQVSINTNIKTSWTVEEVIASGQFEITTETIQYSGFGPSTITRLNCKAITTTIPLRNISNFVSIFMQGRQLTGYTYDIIRFLPNSIADQEIRDIYANNHFTVAASRIQCQNININSDKDSTNPIYDDHLFINFNANSSSSWNFNDLSPFNGVVCKQITLKHRGTFTSLHHLFYGAKAEIIKMPWSQLYLNTNSGDVSGCYYGNDKLKDPEPFYWKYVGNLNFCFTGCSALEIIKEGNYWSSQDYRELYFMTRAFDGCSALIEIEPILNMNAIYPQRNAGDDGQTSYVFRGCNNLAQVHFRSLNNGDYDFVSSTNFKLLSLNDDSIRYAVNNAANLNGSSHYMKFNKTIAYLNNLFSASELSSFSSKGWILKGTDSN